MAHSYQVLFVSELHIKCIPTVQQMAQEDTQFNLRLPMDLKHKLAQAAHANRRSVTGEIIARLDESLAADASPETQDPKAESVERALRQILADIESGNMVLRTKRRT